MTTKEQCCPLDDDRDGNCAIHSAPGVFRNKAMQEALTSNLVSRLRQRLITFPKPDTQPFDVPAGGYFQMVTVGGTHKPGDSAGVLSVFSTCANGGCNKLQEHIYAVDPLCEDAATEIARLRVALTAEREAAREKVRVLDKILDASPVETAGADKPTPDRIGPTKPDNDMVICPTCTSQFRATPVSVQQLIGAYQELLGDPSMEEHPLKNLIGAGLGKDSHTFNVRLVFAELGDAQKVYQWAQSYMQSPEEPAGKQNAWTEACPEGGLHKHYVTHEGPPPYDTPLLMTCSKCNQEWVPKKPFCDCPPECLGPDNTSKQCRAENGEAPQ